MTLTEFLLARIAEDEQVLDVADSVNHYRFGSVRLQRECEAKRRIVGEVTAADEFDTRWDERNNATAEAALNALHHLAAVYADHPDYREEWKP